MKKILFVIAIFIGSMANTSFGQTLTTPQPSTTQTVKQNFGLSVIELSYSRPNVKGRTVMGDLVPYGKVWRTGANQATTLTFGDEVIIGGKKIAPGKYGLVSIPGKDTWTLIITKQLDITSPAAYKEENDVVRVNVKPVSLNENVETFTMQFANVKSGTCDLNLLWDKTAVTLPIATDVDTKVMSQINTIMTKDNLPYFNAAMYYMDNGKDLNQALTWFNKAAEQNPDAFFVHYQRASCLAKLGKKQEAITAATQSLELSKAAKNADYIKLNEDLIAKLR
ncbi:MAG: Tetratricopeptide 2 repeat-containing protein [Ferruginibacter sp.]|nr:Tetratricopeptide 2 repeat-containing protein [Ferruginibacter sp.]